MAAYLGNENVGAITLATTEEKRFLGLWTVLQATVGHRTVYSGWPQGSLEARISSTPLEIEDFVYEWLSDHEEPWGLMVQKIQDGLVARGVLARKKDNDWLNPWGFKYEFTEGFDPTLYADETDSAKELLVRCRHDHPLLWEALHQSVRRAVSRRTRSSGGMGG